MGSVRRSCLGLLLAVACGGRTEGRLPPIGQEEGGSPGGNHGSAGKPNAIAGAPGAGVSADGGSAAGEPTQAPGGTAGGGAAGSIGKGGNPPNGGGSGGAATGGTPPAPADSLPTILPLFSATERCLACVTKLCPGALPCSKGSTCFDQMQCVVDECRATAPAVTDDREGDVGACVSLYATCRDHLESCGLNDDCGRDHAITFQQGLAAVDCLETRCYRSCQR